MCIRDRCCVRLARALSRCSRRAAAAVAAAAAAAYLLALARRVLLRALEPRVELDSLLAQP
eukprot:1094458-Prymnesium_polylepis.1